MNVSRHVHVDINNGPLPKPTKSVTVQCCTVFWCFCGNPVWHVWHVWISIQWSLMGLSSKKRKTFDFGPFAIPSTLRSTWCCTLVSMQKIPRSTLTLALHGVWRVRKGPLLEHWKAHDAELIKFHTYFGANQSRSLISASQKAIKRSIMWML